MANVDLYGGTASDPWVLGNNGMFGQTPTQIDYAPPDVTKTAPTTPNSGTPIGIPTGESHSNLFDPSKVPSGVPADWAKDFIARNPGDYHRLTSAYGSDLQAKQTQYPSPTQNFSDPLSKFLEGWANQRAQNLENPQAGSGQALLEDALKKISAQFQQGGFTPAEQEVFQTQALDPLERLRTARKQQVMEELSRRGIDPRSGVAMSMLQDVDRQFDANRAQTQRSIASQGAQETQQRMLQAVQLLTGLAGTQDNRMNQAFNYYSVPYNLSNNAFNQAMQVYGQNNPLSLIQPLLALSGQQQQRSDNQSSALADLIWAITHAA